MKPLYAKDKRDACIIVAVNHRKYDLGDIDEILENQGLTKLSKGIEEYTKLSPKEKAISEVVVSIKYGGSVYLYLG